VAEPGLRCAGGAYVGTYTRASVNVAAAAARRCNSRKYLGEYARDRRVQRALDGVGEWCRQKRRSGLETRRDEEPFLSKRRGACVSVASVLVVSFYGITVARNSVSSVGLCPERRTMLRQLADIESLLTNASDN